MGEIRQFGRRRRGAAQHLRTGGAGRSQSRGNWLPTIGLMVAAFIASAFMGSLLLENSAAPPLRTTTMATARADAEAARFTHCTAGRGTNCVIDGDTFRYQGDIIRIADIDTPEVRNYGCAAEKTRGDAATVRLLALMNAGPFTLGPYERDRDRYGRLLRIITRDGQSLGMTLVSEGLARQWDGARRSWC